MAATRTRRRGSRAKAPGLLDRIKELPKLATGISAVVTLIVSIVALVLWILPDPPGPTHAKLEVLDFQRHVSLGDYLNQNGMKNPGYTPVELARDGVVATVSAVDVSGVKRADLYWSVRPTTGVLSDKHYRHQLAGHFKIRTTGDSGGRPFWAPAPAPPGRYYVFFELDAPNKTVLATTRTDEFPVQ
jgi:hypothetical protein